MTKRTRRNHTPAFKAKVALAALKGVPILARAASLIAHLLEEQARPIGFVLAHAAEAAIGYDGDAPAGFRPSEG